MARISMEIEITVSKKKKYFLRFNFTIVKQR